MILVWPAGCQDEHAACASRRSWVSQALLVLVLALGIAERLFPAMPEGILDPLGLLGRLRLNQDPVLRSPYQAWTQALVHDGWISLALCALAWWLVAPLVERRLGGWRFALVIAVLAPLGVAVHLVAGSPAPDLGLASVLIGLCGAALALVPQARLGYGMAVWLVTTLLILRRTVRLSVVLAVWLTLEWLRFLIDHLFFAAGGGTAVLMHAANLVAALLAGYLLGVFMERVTPVARPRSRLAELAAGSGTLDALAAVLSEEHHLPIVDLERIAERCLAEDHPSVRLLADYLALRAPESPALALLNARLNLRQEGSDRQAP